MKWYCEFIQDEDGKYCATMVMGGTDICTGIYHEPKRVEGLPKYVDYKTLKEAIKRKTGVEILKRKDMFFNKSGKNRYALIDATQTRSDCRVTLFERKAGWKPCFD